MSVTATVKRPITAAGSGGFKPPTPVLTARGFGREDDCHGAHFRNHG